jgi:hypothetical protein
VSPHDKPKGIVPIPDQFNTGKPVMSNGDFLVGCGYGCFFQEDGRSVGYEGVQPKKYIGYIQRTRFAQVDS